MLLRLLLLLMRRTISERFRLRAPRITNAMMMIEVKMKLSIQCYHRALSNHLSIVVVNCEHFHCIFSICASFHTLFLIVNIMWIFYGSSEFELELWWCCEENEESNKKREHHHRFTDSKSTTVLRITWRIRDSCIINIYKYHRVESPPLLPYRSKSNQTISSIAGEILTFQNAHYYLLDYFAYSL